MILKAKIPPMIIVAGSVCLMLTALAILTPWLPLQDPNVTRLDSRLLSPLSDSHILGTDLLGRDIFSRLLFGLRLSLKVAFIAALVSSIIGAAIGILSGYFRGWFETLSMRGIDLLMSFPYMILALGIVAILGPGLENALLAIAIVNIPFFARTARGLTLGLGKRPFVLAARMSGQSHASILIKEILPNVFPVLLISTTTTFGWMLLETAGLSFLGLGAQAPQADLGSMLADARKLMLIYPHVALAPGLLIASYVVCLNLLGDYLRDRFDPQIGPGGMVRPLSATIVENSPSHPKDEHADLLRIENLCISVGGGHSEIPILHGIDLAIGKGESVGLVGESGSGKSVTALAIARLLPSPPLKIKAGGVHFDGQNLLTLSPSEIQKIRGRKISYIFQDPLTTLNPLMRVGEQISELLKEEMSDTSKRKDKVIELLAQVELPDPKKIYTAYPHELSGGQRQRIVIAMAVATEAQLLIADEPTTALDVTVQRTVLELISRLQKERAASMLFISHDIAVVQAVCQRILVMYKGEIVESGESHQIINNPQHPYTQHLLRSVPVPGKPDKRLPSTPFQTFST